MQKGKGAQSIFCSRETFQDLISRRLDLWILGGACPEFAESSNEGCLLRATNPKPQVHKLSVHNHNMDASNARMSRYEVKEHLFNSLAFGKYICVLL